ncbi:MAG TPA: BON domain-containing protein [Steroidobacteraceae bacterium]|nr:BON domain-containing protein [Steroidobacteraceae bacterium]
MVKQPDNSQATPKTVIINFMNGSSSHGPCCSCKVYSHRTYKHPSLIALLSYMTLRVFRYSIPFAGRIVAIRNMETHTMKNDTQIQQEVLAELEQDETLPSGSIGVEVHHGVVKLAGRISDAETKKRAALDARRVEGVTGIILDMGIERR